MKIAAFLPAKGSSSRIQCKNLKLLDGKPLFLHTLEKLTECDFIDEVYLDTESEEVINLASEINCKILRRKPNLATNKTDGNKLFMNEVNHVKADIYIQILCTSPFIDKKTIEHGIDVIKKKKHDSALLVRKDKFYTWKNGSPAYDINHIPNSIDLKDTVIETMGLYIMTRAAALKTKRRIGDKPYLIEASHLESIDVNFPEDFELANLIAAGLREKERKLLNNLKHIISSPMLSDVLDEMGYKNQVIKNLTPNIDGAKLLGRAKTLKLNKLKSPQNYKSIYKALISYETIIPNDIIIVENEVNDYAYFGEINANLALRAGATGAIISGKTRDSNAVRNLNFPVFSTGNCCQDVKKRAGTFSINKKIQIEGVLISPNDLVFADDEGIVVIPRKIETKVLTRIFKTSSTEKKIIVDISLGKPTEELFKDHGEF